MTRKQLNNLIPYKSMVYPKSEGKSVQYMFMKINEDGKYQLCGISAYEDYIMMDCFEVIN